MKAGRFDRLNLLRIIAFLMVFCLHAKIFIPVGWFENVNFAWIFFTPAWAAVWIFFVLSGYGIGSGFYSGKYELTLKGIAKYYYHRIIKIVPLYWTYIFLIILFLKPRYLLVGSDSFFKILKLFLFCYQEEFDSTEFGLAWYLTTLMRLYLIAPVIYFVIKRYLAGKRYFIISFVCILVLGFLARIAMGYHITETGLGNWSTNIYKPFYFNLDLFCGGFILSELKKNTYKIPVFKIIPWIGLAAIVLYNSYIYFYASYFGTANLNIYCYVLPSVYLVWICFMIFNYDINEKSKLCQNTIENTKKKSVIDSFAKFVMPLYLFHSTVLLCMKNGFDIEWYSKVVHFLHVPDIYMNFTIGMIFTIISLVYTIIFAMILYYVVMKPMNKKLDYTCRCIYEKFCNWRKKKKNETNFK